MDLRDANMNGLAEALIARHLRISVPESVVRVRLAAASAKDYPEELVERQMRCVGVVGAGGSAPLLDRGKELASELELKYGRDEAELERLALVNNLSPTAFETRLIALSRTPDAAMEVRNTISEQYNIRHPTVLCYELLAHLLKHRFLDAIVSFNFDELLDRSLDDELDAGEYARVVSERDCAGIQCDTDADDYVPLYVKLHGTASEPASLRFTPDQYYSLPPQIVRVVEDLLHTEECVIVNVGSGLGSFDFQRLLRIPDRLSVFNLSPTRLESTVRHKIHKERGKPSARQKDSPTDKKQAKLRAEAKIEGISGVPELGYPWLCECSEGASGCDEPLEALIATLTDKACQLGVPQATRRGRDGNLVQFRAIARHEVVSTLLGPSVSHGAVVTEQDSWDKAEIDYLRRRVILELAFAGAKSRGLMSLVPLVRDRPARYYDLYRRKSNGQGETWSALCSAAGLVEAKSIPDVLVSMPSLRSDQGDRPSLPYITTPEMAETHTLHEFDPRRLAEHVAHRVKNPLADEECELLTETIAGLQRESDVELHTQDDRVCSKAFRSPVILKTATSLKAYSWLMFHDLKPEDRVDISSETGGWLLDRTIVRMLKAQEEVRLLLAFDIDRQRLEKAYREAAIKLSFVNPWHHNRHMTIVCKGDRPARAIYFARHLRTPVITAVFLDSVRDVQHLMKMYEIRWNEALENGEPKK